MSDKPEVKNCPVCNKPPQVWENSGSSDGYWIACMDDDCLMGCGEIVVCLKVWNNRGWGGE